jgi:hypothetical protein
MKLKDTNMSDRANNYKVLIYWTNRKHKLSVRNSHIKDEERSLLWCRQHIAKHIGQFNRAYINDRRLARPDDTLEIYSGDGTKLAP